MTTPWFTRQPSRPCPPKKPLVALNIFALSARDEFPSPLCLDQIPFKRVDGFHAAIDLPIVQVLGQDLVTSIRLRRRDD